MIARKRPMMLATALFALCAAAVPASAQITTGSVAGTVKDPQGGVIPGAPVTLISETRGTQLSDVFTNANGDFSFVNVPPDRYSLQVSMTGFKTAKRTGINVSAGDRALVGVIAIEVGGLSETIQVTSEAALVNTQSGERSFTITTDSVENLPIANRSFTALASLAPGVTGTNRIGGGGGNNIMMDGVSAVDTGSNAILLQMNVESIAEVKVLVSGYQAEYGRSSGLQITAVTKSGTNRFRGSAYSVLRNSDWYDNSRTNILNGDPKTVLQEKDLGYSIGGPVGKPGGRNKLFFFYSHEYAPRTGGNDVQRYRMPTALERAGDFSQTIDNNGALYPYIKDPNLTGACSATSQVACFRDGGVLGRIPANRLYDTGLNILKMYPLPNVNIPGAAYNYENTRPTENLTANQPAVRIDYQPMSSLRATFKYSGWSQKNQVINGSIPGWNDSKQYKPVVSTWAATGNYTFNPTTFLEATYGHSQNELTGCGLAQGGTGPTFCQSGFAMNPVGNRFNAGLGNIPYLFPDANVIDPSYYAFEALSGVNPPNFVDGRVVVPPSFAWGSRVSNNNPNYAPPNTPFPGFLNINATDDISISLTKVAGRHTFKSGFYNTHSYKAQQRGGWNGTITFSNDNNNPIDSTFGYANAALGIFSSYAQASKYVEGSFVYNNTEAYVQDNWKVSNKLTLDYGVRFVHQQPQYDDKGQASNFLPDKWALGQAPQLYLAGCPNNVNPCAAASRQAMNPQTGKLLGPGTNVAIGGLVPNSGNMLNGLFLSGQGIAKTTYTWPALGIAPRFGMAYDVSGRQKMVLRGGAGLFFDRPSGNSIYSQVQNPPTYTSVTVRNAQLQTLASGGLTISGAPALNVFEYAGNLPSSTQWNGGLQMALPWSSAIDVEYVGQHSFNTLDGVDINAIDFGAAFLPQNQDLTLQLNTTPGAMAVAQDQMRAFRGYAGITQQWGRGWRTFHSLQLSYNRRFKDGLSFGFNDTIVLSDHQSTGARLQHNADGTYGLRPDQAEADELLGTVIANRHLFKGNFVWDLPDIHSSGSALKALGVLVNDWQVSGVWTGATGSAYTVGFSYQSGGGNVNLTGSPSYGARIRVMGDPGSGCSSNVYQQFNTAAFQGPLTNSVGLESGADYLRGCFTSTLDLAIARNIRLGGARNIQLRVDLFNAPNSAIITGRNTTMNLSNPTNPVTATNLPYDAATGALDSTRSLPRTAGFGVANAYQDPRRVQVQIRFSF
jgi:carboxypeptidase family protein